MKNAMGGMPDFGTNESYKKNKRLRAVFAVVLACFQFRFFCPVFGVHVQPIVFESRSRERRDSRIQQKDSRACLPRVV